jgi:hypothetical protein
VDHLSDKFTGQDVGIAYFYCEYGTASSQSLALFVSSLLKQLSAQKPAVPVPVIEYYQTHKKSEHRPPYTELLAILRQVCGLFDRCFIIVDALDEIDGKKHRGSYVTVLKGLVCSSAQVLVSSRPHAADIEKGLQHASKIRVEAHDADLRLYLGHMLEGDSDMQDLVDEQLKNEILDTLTCNAKGMQVGPAWLRILTADPRSFQVSSGRPADAVSVEPNDEGRHTEKTAFPAPKSRRGLPKLHRQDYQPT